VVGLSGGEHGQWDGQSETSRGRVGPAQRALGCCRLRPAPRRGVPPCPSSRASKGGSTRAATTTPRDDPGTHLSESPGASS